MAAGCLTNRRIGRRSVVFPTHPEIIGGGSVVGVKEGNGPQKEWFDLILTDDYYGEKTFEKAESKMLRSAIQLAMEDAALTKQELDLLIAGDLLNQLMSSSYMARDLGIPYLGMYGACSTMTQSMLAAAMAVDGGYISSAAAAASSHFASAERQFRMPLEHGNQRPPQAQWTATAAGSVILHTNRHAAAETGIGTGVPVQNLNMTKAAGEVDTAAALRTDEPQICVTHGTIGRVIDPGITDTNSMGSAMAPAAFDTIRVHLEDLGRKPKDYDLILTGDLGRVGKWILMDFSDGQLPGFADVYDDCGAIMYDDKQDAHAGGSGCGCSASMIAGRILKELRNGVYRRVMLVSTGALISTISKQQGETVPGIAHAVTLEVFSSKKC